MNGVQVAAWVRGRLPPGRWPQEEDLWLPLEHCLRDFDAEGRKILAHDNSRRFLNPSRVAWHYGPRE